MATYKERWDKYFAFLDGNKNGTLEAEDAKIAGEAAAKGLGYKPGDAGYDAAIKNFTDYLNALIGAFDTNKDGKVTKEEYSTNVEKLFANKNYEQVPDWSVKETNRFFTLLDGNGNGSVSFDEVVAINKRVGSHNSEADLKKAYDYAVGLGGGAFNQVANRKLFTEWTSAAKPVPEFEAIYPMFKF